MEVDKGILNDILEELKNIRESVEELKQDSKELNPGFIEEMKEIEKEDSIKFNSIEELDEIIKNATYS